jgi:hypothetical protein|nr:MAG TPA: Protein of unknown function (DUF2778) [Crassvirales sp.]
MNIEVIRKHFKPSYTIGKLFINGEYFCDTLEDTDRGLTDTMTEEDILKVKVKGNTCIPYGKYEITLNIKSPKYSNFTKYKYAAFAEGKIPRLLNVKGFEGILIHAGNTADHTDGCILVGENKVKGQVINSQATWVNLYKLMKAANDKKEPITITIHN